MRDVGLVGLAGLNRSEPAPGDGWFGGPPSRREGPPKPTAHTDQACSPSTQELGTDHPGPDDRPPGRPDYGFTAAGRVVDLSRFTTADAIDNPVSLVTRLDWPGWFDARPGDVRPPRRRIPARRNADAPVQIMMFR